MKTTYTSFFLLCLLLSSISISAQNIDFDFAFDLGNTSDDAGNDVIVDPADGSYYVVGNFTNTVDFDPLGGVSSRTSHNNSSDIFIAKYTSQKTLVWVRSVGGNINNYAARVAVDGNSNVYICGLFYGTVDFNPGAGVVNRTAIGNANAYLLKLNSAGTYQWVLSFGGTSLAINGNIATGLVVDSNNDIYLSGAFEGNNINFNPRGIASNQSTGADINSFLAKYNSNGILLWVKNIGNGTQDDAGYSVALDANDNVFYCGDFEGCCDFNPFVFGGTLCSAGGGDGFVASYTSAGVYRWAKRFGGISDDKAKAISVDAQGYVAVAGGIFPSPSISFYGSAITITTGRMMLARYDNAGVLQWANNIGTGLGGVSNEVMDIVVDGCGHIYVGGRFQGTTDFDPGAGTANLTAPSGFPIENHAYFLARYNSDGSYAWAKTSGVGRSMIYGLALDGCENIYMTGTYNQRQDFNITAGIYNRTPAGGYDIFLSKHYLPHITVTNGNNTGEGSIRNAIDCANAHIGRDTIRFCIPGAGTHTIYPATVLPFITDDLTIFNAKTQPGYTLGRIGLRGANLTGTQNRGLRFNTGADDCEVLGMSVRGFPGHNIYFTNVSGGKVIDSHIGDSGQDGIRFYNSPDGVVQGCIIGLWYNGTSTNANGRDGIASNGTADNLQIGGPNPGDGNVISGNTRYGIYLISDNNRVEGNYIGLTAGGTSRPNRNDGIRLNGERNIIGGSAARANIIAFNTGHGVEIVSNVANDENLISQNSMYCNTAGGILTNAGNQSNAAPVIVTPDVTGIYGTSQAGAIIEVFYHDGTGCALAPCQGKTYLGTATADAFGVWALIGAFIGGNQVTATQTDNNDNTSNFSICATVATILADEDIQLQAQIEQGQAQLQWSFTSQNQVADFYIERSERGEVWEKIGEIGAEAGEARASFVDERPVTGINHYRVRQMRSSGDWIISNVVSIKLEVSTKIALYPNPSAGWVNVEAAENILELSIMDAQGRELLVQSPKQKSLRLDLSSFAAGSYWLRIRLAEKSITKVFILE